MPDQNNAIAALSVTPHLVVHLGYQRARGIPQPQPAALGLAVDFGRRTVGGQDDDGAGRHLVQLIHEGRAAFA
jgi:hypothetical protein